MKDRLMLLIAVIAGLAATALAFVYIDSATVTADEAPPAKTLEVLFTINDLAANAVIDADTDLKVETINVDATPGIARGAVKATERSVVNGRPVSAPIPAGTPLLYSYLTQVQDVDLGVGMRAMSITVDRENLMGGLLVPGDYVDIIVSYRKAEEKEAPADNAASDSTEDILANAMSEMLGGLGSTSTVPSEWVSEEVLGNVRVIAVGRALSGSRQAQMYGMASGGSGGSTITLEVTSAQALDLIRAQANGSNPLTLLLRPQDTSGESTARSTLTGG